jgi:predicted peroxiredoxin
MASYLLIESRDPFEVNDVDYYYDIASGLKSRNNEVTLFLVQNGVFPARQNPSSEQLSQLAELGVRILADELSLNERGITVDCLVDGVVPSSLDIVIEQMVAGAKTIWH